MAEATWHRQRWQERGVEDVTLPRIHTEEGRGVPYLRDIFDAGCAGAAAEDIVVYTNADICVRSDCAAVIAAELQDHEALYAFRVDFNHRFTEPIADGAIGCGVQYPGSDLKAFRVRWWRRFRDVFPDMLIGCEAWDPCMRVLIEDTNRGTNNAIPNLIYHERHPTKWENSANRYRLKGQIHNLRLAYAFMVGRSRHPGSFGIRKV